MDHKSSQHRKRRLTYILLLLAIVSAYAGYQAYKVYNSPPIFAVKHYLSVHVVNDKDYKAFEEVMGSAEVEQTMVILPSGGIYFYKPAPGWNVTREVNVSNAFYYPVEIETEVVGNITQFLTIDLPKASMEPKESQIMALTVRIPKENVMPGYYQGNLTIKFIPKKT